jgi:hypothetical protein
MEGWSFVSQPGAAWQGVHRARGLGHLLPWGEGRCPRSWLLQEGGRLRHPVHPTGVPGVTTGKVTVSYHGLGLTWLQGHKHACNALDGAIQGGRLTATCDDTSRTLWGFFVHHVDWTLCVDASRVA